MIIEVQRHETLELISKSKDKRKQVCCTLVLVAGQIGYYVAVRECSRSFSAVASKSKVQ